jgi:ligand-binding sensor domain-containing protein
MRDDTWNYFTASSHPFFERIRDLTIGSKKVWIATYGNGCGYISGDSLTVITEEDSLMDNRVLTIVEETPSKIWFGTASGVCYANSFKWESMRYGNNIPNGSINDLIFDEGKNLFIAVCRQGVSRYKFGKVTNYTNRDGLPGWDINAFSLDLTGKLIAGGNKGLSSYDGFGWTPFRVSGIPLYRYNFLSIYHDQSGKCFLGTDEGTIVIIERGSVKKLELPQAFPALQISVIYGFENQLYFVTGDGVFKLEDRPTKIDLPGSWYSDVATDIVVTGDNQLWIATRFGILRSLNGSWEILDRRSGLPTEYFTSIAVDPKQGVWFGTFESGILHFSDGKWYHYTTDNGLPSNCIKDIMFDGRGKLWAITIWGKIACYSDGSWQQIGPNGDNSVYSQRVAKKKNISFVNDPDVYFLSDPKDKLNFSGGGCLGRDNSGSVMIAGKDGIYLDSSGKWSRIDFPKTGLEISPTALIETKGSDYWLGTRNSGLFVFSRGEWEHLEASSGFPGKSVLSLHEDLAGRIWIGTASSGICRFVYSVDAKN